MNNQNSPSDPFDNAPVVFRYTRAQALADGVLVDLTPWARDHGFKIPVACTAAVWHQYIVPPHGTEPLGQSERGRAHDLLWVLYCAIRRLGSGPYHRELQFKVAFLQAPQRLETVTLKAHCGPGDHVEPVLTIMRLDED